MESIKWDIIGHNFQYQSLYFSKAGHLALYLAKSGI